ncbi:hypothetical protein DBV23_07505 [Edwardsiella ictaluri]|uniref:LPS-assembly lipoprotein LptM n=2 Tax=Edwardsiella ictaluri TaxID=67780 RepID=C5BBD3_EDWI9|nr:lipoprotein [Edwardsiella ictaluri]ACR67368.1 lipoprotein, putative [Edwardsiella ictaluri 93-146]ARD39955.1 hypothetical protein B6E78_11720 [Edwardsiella ictaluri]AVZ82122.1 hypothetical protein DBV23_07505 [Edwardsiella ictaluri]EKS7762706.1 lipoprotein [Edwardsiella ictaluri]EKS7769617.1 lipoprotein [Edwardsiella ictaluri]
MNRQFRSALLVLCAATLGGCGLKGPLYFPPAQQAPVAQKAPDAYGVQAPSHEPVAQTPNPQTPNTAPAAEAGKAR